MPTGWRPADVAEKFPLHKIEDVYHFEKYDPKASAAMKVWSWIQLFLLLLFISYLFAYIATIGSPDIFIYGAFVFLGVYALTELMDRNPYALLWESIKNIFGLAILFAQGDWFGASQWIPQIQYMIFGYLVISTMITAWFVYVHKKEDAQLVAA